MNEFILFLKDYWKLIVAGVFFIASLVIAIIRKKPVVDILTDIYEFCILAINDAEVSYFGEGQKNGSHKLALAIRYVKQLLKDKYPTIEPRYYENLIEKTIELILTTPQKKGDDK